MSLFGGGSKPDILARLDQMMVRAIPFNVALGLRLEDAEDGVAVMRLPYREELVGNPQTGVLHGGMMTAMLDAACGMAVFLKLQTLARIATLDLRIDYLHPATPPRDVLARAECYRTTRDVAFVRALAHHGDASDPIAAAAGTFAIFSAGPG